MFFQGSPEELGAHLAAQHDHRVMAYDEARHALHRLWETLPEDELLSLRQLMSTIGSSGEDARALANYYEGIIAATMKARFGTCLACGLNHAEQLTALATPEQPEP